MSYTIYGTDIGDALNELKDALNDVDENYELSIDKIGKMKSVFDIVGQALEFAKNEYELFCLDKYIINSYETESKPNFSSPLASMEYEYAQVVYCIKIKTSKYQGAGFTWIREYKIPIDEFLQIILRQGV